MPALFRENRDNYDDDVSTSSDSESSELEYNILNYHFLPPLPSAIRVYQDQPDRHVNHRDILIQGPRNLRRGANISMETFNGFLRLMVPDRITGMVIRRNELFYLVVWLNHGNTAYCIQARFLNGYTPSLVIEFHQQVILDLIRNIN